VSDDPLAPRASPADAAGATVRADALDAILSASPDLVYLCDRAGRHVYVNAAAARAAGRSAGEMLGRTWRELGLASAVMEPLDARRAAVFATEQPSTCELVAPTGADGRERVYEYALAPIRGADGALDAVVAIGRDVTAMRLAALRLQALAEASRAFAEAGLDLHAAFDAVVRYVAELTNDGCALLLLAADTRVLETVAVHHPTPATRALLAAMLSRPYRVDEGLPGRVYQTGEPILIAEFDPRGVPATARAETHAYFATVRPHSVLLVPVRLRGRTIGVLTVSRDRAAPAYGADDVSLLQDLAERAALAIENARLYREAQEASRLKDEFLATVSHELRTPLTAILGWAQLLRGGTVAAGDRALATIERNARAQAQIIDDLLDASRIISGKLQIEPRLVAMGAVVRAAVESVRLAADAKGITLDVAVEPGSDGVRGESGRLQQVLWNLLSNAIKFTPRGGHVGVAVARRDGHVEVVVRDDGAGIRADFLPYVFDRFRQAESSSRRAHGGLGLGLSIVRYLAELHGGSVHVESAGENLGAAFTLRLPAAERASEGTRGARTDRAASDPPRRNDRAALAGLRVLVVDDEPDARDLLLAVLSDCGAEAVAVASVTEALAALTERHADVLVSDIGMPGHDGYDLIREVRSGRGRAFQAIPAVALTAYASADDRRRALAAGFSVHVPKPIEPHALVAVVAGLARGAS